MTQRFVLCFPSGAQYLDQKVVETRWSSPRGQNEVIADDDTCYEYGLSTCNVRVPWSNGAVVVKLEAESLFLIRAVGMCSAIE